MNPISPYLMYIFPGQGSQYVGIGSDLYEEFAAAREIYQRASDVLGFDVARLSFEGPKEQLDKTAYTQPALLTHSIACLEVFRELTDGRWSPTVVAGHSLGEYSALVAAEALTLEDAVQLVRQRGKLMSQYGRGKMVAFRLDLDSIKSIADGYYCGIGGCNLPDQTVVCGFEEDLDEVIEEVVEKFGKAKAGRYLNTEGAFHTYLMMAAAEHFRAHLEAVSVQTPKVNVLSNYTGGYHSPDPAKIRAALFFQIFHPVKWMWGLRQAIGDGVNTIIEFGGGIGRERPGIEVQQPSTRKPNLEGITKKSLELNGHAGLYMSAINSNSLRRSADMLGALQHVVGYVPVDTQAADADTGQKYHRLHIPVRDAIISAEALNLVSRLQQAGLDKQVQIVTEPHEQTLQRLKSDCDAEITAAEPYLMIKAGDELQCCRGDDIERELSSTSGATQQNNEPAAV